MLREIPTPLASLYPRARTPEFYEEEFLAQRLTRTTFGRGRVGLFFYRTWGPQHPATENIAAQ